MAEIASVWMKIMKKTLLLLFLTLVNISACEPIRKNQPDGKSEAADPGDEPRVPPKGPPTGPLLFKTTKDAATLAADKAQFLTNVFAKKDDGRYALNNRYVAYRNLPFSPIIFGYVASGGEVSFTAKLNDDFRNNIPQKIIDKISEYDVDSLDLFFTPQKYDGKGFKPHSWAADPPAPGFVGSIYDRNLEVAVFDSDSRIDKDIKSEKMTSWNFSVHDGTLSPQQPELNITGSMPISFWSLVVDPVDKKAAVTLHWLLFEEEKDAITNAIKDDHPQASMDKLIKKLELMPKFAGTPMMKKLKDFVR
jgi:hypothetical protein